MKCEQCGKEVVLPFTCTYCGKSFCDEHRLPESHECDKLPSDSRFWFRHKKLVNANTLQLGICPNCGSQSNVMTGYDAKTMTFQCKECGDKYVQSKAFPFGYMEHGKKIESVGKSESYHKPPKIHERTPSKARYFSSVSLRPRKLLLSLKLWFLVFWVIVVLISFVESSNSHLYQSVPDSLKFILYVFASIIGIWSGYRVFEKCDYNPRSDRGIFGLKLLSIGIFIIAFLTFIFGIFFLSGLTQTQSGVLIAQASLARNTASVFLIVLSFVLIILSAYLLFKFERRSGVIVYRR